MCTLVRAPHFFKKKHLAPMLHSNLAMNHAISKRRNYFFKNMRCAPRGARRIFFKKKFLRFEKYVTYTCPISLSGCGGEHLALI